MAEMSIGSLFLKPDTHKEYMFCEIYTFRFRKTANGSVAPNICRKRQILLFFSSHEEWLKCFESAKDPLYFFIEPQMRFRRVLSSDKHLNIDLPASEAATTSEENKNKIKLPL